MDLISFLTIKHEKFKMLTIFFCKNGHNDTTFPLGWGCATTYGLLEAGTGSIHPPPGNHLLNRKDIDQPYFHLPFCYS